MPGTVLAPEYATPGSPGNGLLWTLESSRLCTPMPAPGLASTGVWMRVSRAASAALLSPTHHGSFSGQLGVCTGCQGNKPLLASFHSEMPDLGQTRTHPAGLHSFRPNRERMSKCESSELVARNASHQKPRTLGNQGGHAFHCLLGSSSEHL